jgi:hypothetical protein
MKNCVILALVVLTIGLTSCVKKESTDTTTPSDPVAKTMKDLVIPASFDFQTTKEVTVGILVKNSS